MPHRSPVWACVGSNTYTSFFLSRSLVASVCHVGTANCVTGEVKCPRLSQGQIQFAARVRDTFAPTKEPTCSKSQTAKLSRTTETSGVRQVSLPVFDYLHPILDTLDRMINCKCPTKASEILKNDSHFNFNCATALNLRPPVLVIAFVSVFAFSVLLGILGAILVAAAYAALEHKHHHSNQQSPI